MSTSRNYSDAIRTREAAALVMQLGGIPSAAAHLPQKRISDHLGELAKHDGPRSDITGVADTWISVSSRLTHRISLDIDEARRDANRAGMKIAVLVQHRVGRSVAESYAIMTLADLTALLVDRERVIAP